jgi:hypothetical protein
MRRTGRGRNNGSGIKYDLFPVCTVVTLRNDHGHHLISDLDACCHTFAYLIDDAGRVHPRYVWRRVDFLLFGPRTVPGHGICRIYRRRVDSEAYLPGTGVNLGKIDDLENLWAAMNEESYCTHLFCLSLLLRKYMAWSGIGQNGTIEDRDKCPTVIIQIALCRRQPRQDSWMLD